MMQGGEAAADDDNAAAEAHDDSLLAPAAVAEESVGEQREAEQTQSQQTEAEQSEAEQRHSESSATNVTDKPVAEQSADQQGEMGLTAQGPEAGSIAAVLASLSVPKVEVAPGQTHAEVLMAEQAQELEAVQQLPDDQPQDLVVPRQHEEHVIQLEQHEPTAEEDASQHMQLKHLKMLNAASAREQPVQPAGDSSEAVTDGATSLDAADHDAV